MPQGVDTCRGGTTHDEAILFGGHPAIPRLTLQAAQTQRVRKKRKMARVKAQRETAWLQFNLRLPCLGEL